MNRILLCLVLLALAAPISGGAEPLKIHILSGSKEYGSEPSLKAFEAHLEDNFEVTVTASWVKDGSVDLPGVGHIPGADLLIVFARRLKLPEDQMALVRNHWQSGKPVIGIRTASHAFGDDDDAAFDREVLGGNYAGHFGNEVVKVENREGSQTHPILEGVGEITSRKLYKAGQLGEKAVALQDGRIEGKADSSNPVTWANEFKGGRTFYTALGVPDDFEGPDFVRMLVNAVFWTTKRSATGYHK